MGMLQNVQFIPYIIQRNNKHLYVKYLYVNLLTCIISLSHKLKKKGIETTSDGDYEVFFFEFL